MAALVIGLMVWATAAPAGAHDPVFLTDEQTTPDVGPYFPDGTVSWAIYSTLHGAGETRAFEFDLADGERLILGLLIPNLEPELSLAADELPRLSLELPDGSVQEIDPIIGAVFDEPFSGTSYVRLHSSREDAPGGRYRATVTARAPARVSVAIGDREVFGTRAERVVGRAEGLSRSGSQLNAWYSTPPGLSDAAPPGEDPALNTSEGEGAAVKAGADDDGLAATSTPNAPATEPAAIDAYLTGPGAQSTTDRLFLPMTILAIALVVAALARTINRRLRTHAE